MSDLLAARMAELSARLVAQAGGYRARLAAAGADRAAVTAQAHKLAGIAAMLGHPKVGEAALALEERVEAEGDYARELAALDALLAALET